MFELPLEILLLILSAEVMLPTQYNFENIMNLINIFYKL
jgi:hypothetical protein